MSTTTMPSDTDLPSLPQHVSLAAFAKPVAMTASLAYFVGGDVVIDGDLHPIHGMPSPADVAEAKRKLVEAVHVCRPASPQTIAAWVQRLCVLPWGPKDRTATQDAVAAVVLACGELPASVWTAETSGEALRAFKRWPAPAEIYELLLPRAKAFWRTRDGLKRVAERQEAKPEPREPVTDDAREAVAALVREFVAERSFNDLDQRETRNAGTSLTLSDERLLAEYDRLAELGNRPAAARADMLRDQIRRRVKEADRWHASESSPEGVYAAYGGSDDTMPPPESEAAYGASQPDYEDGRWGVSGSFP